MIASLSIFLLALGGIGGSFQPSRIFILLSGILFFIKNKTKQKYIGITPLIKKGLVVYFIWIAYGLFTLQWAPDPLLGLKSEIIVMAIGMSSLFFFPFYYRNDLSTLTILVKMWTWSCIFTLPIAYYEIITFQHFFYLDDDRVLGGLGINVPFAAIFFGNYNGYSNILCFYFPFLLISFINASKKSLRFFLGFVLVLTVLVLLINTSRGALLACAIISISAIRFTVKKICLAILSIFVTYFLLPAKFKNIIDTVIFYRFGTDSGGAFEDSLRTDLFKAGIEFIKDSYGFGIGAGGFEELMPSSKYYSGMINPHNIFIEIVSQYGILIFILFVYWLCIIGYGVWKNKTLSIQIRKILVSTLLCFPIIGAINSAALGYTYWWIFLTTVALIASIKPNSIISYKEYK